MPKKSILSIQRHIEADLSSGKPPSISDEKLCSLQHIKPLVRGSELPVNSYAVHGVGIILNRLKLDERAPLRMRFKDTLFDIDMEDVHPRLTPFTLNPVPVGIAENIEAISGFRTYHPIEEPNVLRPKIADVLASVLIQDPYGFASVTAFETMPVYVQPTMPTENSKEIAKVAYHHAAYTILYTAKRR